MVQGPFAVTFRFAQFDNFDFIGGAFNDRDDSVRYFIYPELINECANTIITQIDSLLRHTIDRQLPLHEIVFVFDNHATQKNCFVLAYFEYLAKSNVIGKGGISAPACVQA